MSAVLENARPILSGVWKVVRALALAAAVGLLPAGPSGAQTSWQQKIGTFRVGMLAEPGTDNAVAGLSALKKAYTLALGVPVEFFIASNFQTLIEAQISHRIDYGVYSAAAYAATALACECVSPLVAPTSANGAVGIRSVLIGRSDVISDIAEISRHRVAVGGTDDVTGYLLPMAALRKSGIVTTGEEPFLVHTASIAEAQSLLLAGQVDAMFGWIETGVGKRPLPGSGTLEALEVTGTAADVFKIVWTSDLLRYGPHAIRKDLEPEVRRRLVPFLIGLKDTDPDVFDTLEGSRTGGFVSVNDADYATAVDMVRAATGLDR